MADNIKLGVYFALLIAIVLGLWGWVCNLITLFTTYDTMAMPEFLLRLVGVPIAIIGAVMGWL